MGERDLIRLFTEKFKVRAGRLPLPFGDDVSAWRIGGGRLAILKVDMLIGGTDVLPGMDWRQAGWKALTMAVSDFAAKGVKPEAALVGVGIPRGQTSLAGSLAEGLKAAARRYGVTIIGGDTNEAEDLTVAVCLYGTARQGQVISRFNARPGDLLAVSGNFGLTGAAFKILLEGLDVDEPVKAKILESVYWPRARLNLGLKLKRLGVTAAIDSSDGLAWSLHELSRASGVGFRVERLPAAREAKVFAERHGLDLFDLTFYAGEEYELVVTVRPEALGRIRGKLRVIGVATRERKVYYDDGRVQRPIRPGGWEHFKSKIGGRSLESG